VAGTQWPQYQTFFTWLAGIIAASMGTGALAIAHEDGKQAAANAIVDVAKVQAASGTMDAPANATTVNVGAQTPSIGMSTGGTS
jgi:hypothetical protein